MSEMRTTMNPHVLLIMVHDVGQGDIEYDWKHSLVQMPNIEKLEGQWESHSSTPIRLLSWINHNVRIIHQTSQCIQTSHQSCIVTYPAELLLEVDSPTGTLSRRTGNMLLMLSFHYKYKQWRDVIGDRFAGMRCFISIRINSSR